MRTITIEAKSIESAQGIRDALAALDAELSGSDVEGYHVSVTVTDGNRQVTDILDVLDSLPLDLDTRRANVSITVASDDAYDS